MCNTILKQCRLCTEFLFTLVFPVFSVSRLLCLFRWSCLTGAWLRDGEHVIIMPNFVLVFVVCITLILPRYRVLYIDIYLILFRVFVICGWCIMCRDMLHALCAWCNGFLCMLLNWPTRKTLALSSKTCDWIKKLYEMFFVLHWSVNIC